EADHGEVALRNDPTRVIGRRPLGGADERHGIDTKEGLRDAHKARPATARLGLTRGERLRARTLLKGDRVQTEHRTPHGHEDSRADRSKRPSGGSKPTNVAYTSGRVSSIAGHSSPRPARPAKTAGAL